MRTVFFVRANNEDGIKKQIEDLNKYCEEHKYEVITSPFVVTDNKDRLPMVIKMLKFCKDNKDNIDMVLCSDFSRLTRKPEECLPIFTCLYNCGITPWAVHISPHLKSLLSVACSI